MQIPDPNISRRSILGAAAVGGAAFAAARAAAAQASSAGGASAGAGHAGAAAAGAAQNPAAAGGAASGPFVLPPLPYAMNALEPVISARTLEFHYGKHHKGYVDTLNDLVKGTDMAGLALPALIQRANGDKDKVKVFNNAAQIWNHTFYWESLKPSGGGKPSGELLKRIEAAFKSFDECKAALVDAAVTQFGSGWAWLVLEGDQLKIAKTANADNPLVHAQTPLLTIDVWEHAYYLDYQNLRKKYATELVEKLVNWDAVAARLQPAAR